MRNLFLIVALFFLFSGVGIAFNITESINNSVFVLVPEKYQGAKRGDLVSFYQKDSSFKDILVTKRLLGRDGDLISYSVSSLHINGEKLLLKSTARDGAVLHKIDVDTVPKGKIFVAGDHKDSFDSRYKEFGLVDEKDIVYVAHGFL
jgi:signal peptidase I